MKRTAFPRRHPPRMSPAERNTRLIVRYRAGDEGLCETCLTVRGAHASHRKRRSQGGPWCPSNILWQCPPCHLRTDSPDPEVARLGWHLKSWQDPLTTPVFLARHGWVLLDDSGGFIPCAAPIREEAE